jgi:hypothetical protein
MDSNVPRPRVPWARSSETVVELDADERPVMRAEMTEYW